MGFFKSNYNKPGPGVSKDAPKKKGLARLWEILARDTGSLIKINLIYALVLLPVQIMFLLAFFFIGTKYMFVFVLLGLAASFPLGGATTAMVTLITKMLRDEPGFFWQDFKKAFKENFRPTMLPGILYSLILCGQMIGVYYFFAIGGVPLPLLAVYLFSSLIFLMAIPYYFLQSAYLQLGPMSILKNSLLLATSNLPRSFAGMVLQTGLMVAQFIYLPVTVPLLLILGYSLPCLLSLMNIWPPVDRVFKIDETLKERAAKQLDEALGETNSATFNDAASHRPKDHR